MRRKRTLAIVFVLLVLAGTARDRSSDPRQRTGVLVADLHVHPFPGDGALTVWQLQREASRRGLDVIAVAGHNNRLALNLARALGLVSDVPMILESQELTAPDFHMIAVGVTRMIDWRHSVPDAVAAIHAQGGVAIAAHPVSFAWKPRDDESLRALDGVEVAHPMAERTGWSRRELDGFFAAARAAKPAVAPIGSTDFHGAAPLGLCRTYVLTHLASPAGVLEAIRQGRTVAEDQYGRLYGSAHDIPTVRASLAEQPAPPPVSRVDRLIALSALFALALVASDGLRASTRHT
jgi:hypothetical protein